MEEQLVAGSLVFSLRYLAVSWVLESMHDKGSDEIALKAMGRAINKTVMIAELIKRRIAGLHQNTSIGSTDITDMWEPLEEGLLPLETTRHVSVIAITLSKKELDISSTGYQPPIPADQVRPWTEYDYEGEGSPAMRGRGRSGRGRGRGRGNNNNGMVEYNGDGGWDGVRGGMVAELEAVEEAVVIVGVEEAMVVEICNKKWAVTMTMDQGQCLLKAVVSS
ncbi:Ribonuclease P protein subunit p25-like protein [Vitis vinifera]|uniref:Ribonuclease P protein subunit p25-like protein n=1 Tax=Vitis vinifera TaxID=29760 RepID=A0A438EMH6_VITVI|nr:Ribonuclease P protein subunit p25-like protein [Vitis vinifera]RVX13303.1 Ribonuclease P protein subunit p25-like protein [Vitis vinifera]